MGYLPMMAHQASRLPAKKQKVSPTKVFREGQFSRKRARVEAENKAEHTKLVKAPVEVVGKVVSTSHAEEVLTRHAQSDDEGLARFESGHAGEDVDAVDTEGGQEHQIGQVERAQVHRLEAQNVGPKRAEVETEVPLVLVQDQQAEEHRVNQLVFPSKLWIKIPIMSST